MKIILLLSLVTRCISIDRFPWYDTALPLETRLDTLINEMTFQEKISQTLSSHLVSDYRTTCNAESFHSKGMCGMEKFAAAKYYDFLEIENPDFVSRGTSSQCRCSKQYDIPDAHEYGTILECIISENYFRTHW